MLLRQCISLGDPNDKWSKRLAITFHLMKFDICFLEVECVNWSYNKENL